MGVALVEEAIADAQAIMDKAKGALSSFERALSKPQSPFWISDSCRLGAMQALTLKPATPSTGA